MRGESPELLGKRLSPQESAILIALYSDKSKKMIAAEMYLSFYTVRNHCTAIYRKRGVPGRIGLMAARIAELEAA